MFRANPAETIQLVFREAKIQDAILFFESVDKSLRFMPSIVRFMWLDAH